jgi:hypothetical protein
LSADVIDDLSERCVRVAAEVAVPNLSFWIWMFPLAGAGARLFFAVGSRLCFSLMGLEAPE